MTMKKIAFLFTAVFAWILWEQITFKDGRPAQWRNQTSYNTEQECRRDAGRIVDDIRSNFIRNGLPAAYLFNVGVGGFDVTDKEMHVFQCYPSDFDPRPRA